MADKPKKPTRYTTPKGRYVFPKLNEPDTKFKDDGEFSNQLALMPDEAAPLLKLLEPIYEKAMKAAKAAWKKLPEKSPKGKKKPDFDQNPLYFNETDKDGNETGAIVFKFSTNATYKDKKGKTVTRRVPMFDAKSNLLAKTPEVWGGTIGKVSFTIGTDKETGEPGYFVPATGAAGLKLYLEGVQIIDLRTSGARSAGDYGFGEEEGGFDGSDSDSSDDGDDTKSDDTDGDDTDDEPF